MGLLDGVNIGGGSSAPASGAPSSSPAGGLFSGVNIGASASPDTSSVKAPPVAASGAPKAPSSAPAPKAPLIPNVFNETADVAGESAADEKAGALKLGGELNAPTIPKGAKIGDSFTGSDGKQYTVTGPSFDDLTKNLMSQVGKDSLSLNHTNASAIPTNDTSTQAIPDETTGDTLGTLKAIATGVAGIPSAILNAEKTPSADEAALEQKAGFNDYKDPTKSAAERIIATPADVLGKSLFRFFQPMIQPVGDDIAAAILGNSSSARGKFGMTMDQVMKMPSYQKSSAQIVGDVSQAVLAAYTPSLFSEGVSNTAEWGVRNAFVQGAKNGASFGFMFGAAQAASSGTTDAGEITKTILVSTIGMALLSGLAHSAIPFGRQALQSMTKDIITQYKLPETVTIPADVVFDHLSGRQVDEFLSTINMDVDTMKYASKNGLTVEIPMESIVTMTDKPWFASLKEKLGLPSSEPEITAQGGGEPAARATPAGLLGTAADNADQARVIPQTEEHAAELPIISAMHDIEHSEAMDIQASIKNGDIERTDIYVDDKSDVVKPEFAQGRIDDIAEKLDLYKKGLGDTFRGMVDVNDVTMKGNVPEGLVKTAEDLMRNGVPAGEEGGITPPHDIANTIADAKKNLGMSEEPAETEDDTEHEPLSPEGIDQSISEAKDESAESSIIKNPKGQELKTGDTVFFNKYSKGKATGLDLEKPYTIKDVTEFGDGLKVLLNDAKGGELWTTPESIEKSETSTETAAKDDITTPIGVAKDLIRVYVERGDSLQSIKNGRLGTYSDTYKASIGGYVNGKSIGADKIRVEAIGNKKVDEIISLKKVYDEIKAESEKEKAPDINDKTAKEIADADKQKGTIVTSVPKKKVTMMPKHMAPLVKEVQKFKNVEEFKKSLVESDHGGNAIKMRVPVSLLEGSEPSNAAKHLEGAGPKEITEPIDVIYNVNNTAAKEYGRWLVMDGHHRLYQAGINGDKDIIAHVNIIDEKEPGDQDNLLNDDNIEAFYNKFSEGKEEKPVEKAAVKPLTPKEKNEAKRTQKAKLAEIVKRFSAGDITMEEANAELKSNSIDMKIGDIQDPLNPKQRERMNKLAQEANEKVQKYYTRHQETKHTPEGIEHINTFKEAEGAKKVDILPDVDTFIFKEKGGWNISEGTTGLNISWGKTMQKATELAREKMTTFKGEGGLQSFIKSQGEKLGFSPRAPKDIRPTGYDHHTNILVESYARGEEAIKRMEGMQQSVDAQEEPEKFKSISKEIEKEDVGNRSVVKQLAERYGLGDYEVIDALSTYIDAGTRRGGRTLKDFYNSLDLMAEDAKEAEMLKTAPKGDAAMAFEKKPDLVKGTKSMGEIEKNVESYVAGRARELKRAYLQKHGNVFNVDEMKDLIPSHAENRTMSEAFHKPAAKLMGSLVNDAIEAGKGKDQKITFLAGATASGKSTAVQFSKKDSDVVIDGTLASDRSLDEVRKALNAGFTVHIWYVENTPERLLDNAITRAAGGGRTVPIETMYNTLIKSRQNLLRAAGKYGDNPRFTISVIDNGKDVPEIVEDGVDFIKSRPYSKEAIEEAKAEAYEHLDDLKAHDEINPRQYEGFTRRRGEDKGEIKATQPEGRPFDGEEHTEVSDGQNLSSIALPHVPAPRETSIQLNAEIIPGLMKSVTEDMLPAAKATIGGIKSAMKELSNLLNPVSVAPKEATDIMMIRKGEFEKKLFRTERAVIKIKKMWDKQPENARLEFMSKMERGEKMGSPDLQALADLYRDRLDSAHTEISAYKDINFLENFFPHFWNKPEEVEKKFIPGMMSRRPLQGPKPFTKERVFETIQEGIKAGYTPVTTNPEELMQVYETNVRKFVMAQKIKEDMLAKGLWKFVPMGEKAPEGFTKINDAIAQIYYKENKTLSEFYDEHLMNGLNNLADALGIKHERKLSFGGRGRRGAAGLSMPGKNEVWTKFGSPESVFMHELGHQIDERYGLKEKLVMHSDYKQELRDLADKRMAGHEGDTNFQKYIRKGEEKMAVMFEAYLHAPNLFRDTAPKAFNWFIGFMGSHPELRPILDLRPSLVLAGDKKTIEGPMIKGGEYYAQEDAARLINNHLSRDFIYESALGTGIMNLKNTMNAFQLGLSAFHGTMETLDSIITKFSIGLSKVVSGNFLSGFADMAKSPLAPYSFLRSGQKFFADDPELKGIEDALFTGGASLKSRQYYKNNVLDTFMKNVREGNIPGAIFRAPLAIVEGTMRPLFSYYVPRLKVGAFRELYAQQLEQHSQDIQDGKMTQAELARKVWANIENRMGEINYDNLFWNRTLKTSAMLMFRSVGWNLGTVREIGGAFLNDLPKEAKNAFRGKGFNFTPKMSYTMSLFFVTAVIGGIYMYLHTGKRPGSLLDLFYPENGATDAQGNKTRVQFPTYLKDIWQYTHQPIQTIADKFAPEFTAIIELLQNRDFYGDNIRNTNDNLPTQAKQVALFLLSQFEPFTFSNINQQSKGNTGMEQRVESFFGIMNAPKAAVEEGYAAYLQQLYTSQVGASGPKTPEEKAIASEKAKARQQIQAGDYSGLKDLVAQGIIKPEGMKKFIADAKLNTNQRMYQGLSKANKALFNAQYGSGVSVNATGTPTYAAGTKTTSTGIIGTVVTYATALGTDPISAFHDIFSGQTIKEVTNGTILVDRMSLSDSTGIRKEMGATSGMILDHIVPLEAGGTNDKSNLQLTSTAEDAGDQQNVEDFLGREVQAGTMSGAKAREFAIRFKAGMGETLSPELMKEYKDHYGGIPVTAQDIFNYSP